MEEREDFVDMVAQAVVDRIEENERFKRLVNLVAVRALELQKEAIEAEELAKKEVDSTEQVD